ncbi:MAG: hypothetical protein ABGZ53_11610 [Fuerstiella sp.]
MTYRLVVVSVTSCLGCALQSIPVADNAQPVIRPTFLKHFKDISPGQPVAFAGYIVTASKRRRTTTDGRTIPLFRSNLNRIRKEGGVDFDLTKNGVTVAQVSARSYRKQKRYRTNIGNFNYSNDDLLDGHVTLASGLNVEFAVQGFNSRSRGVKAVGQLQVGQYDINIREVEAPVINQSRGFAGAEFFLNNQRIGQVLRYGDEHVWIDEQQRPWGGRKSWQDWRRREATQTEIEINGTWPQYQREAPASGSRAFRKHTCLRCVLVSRTAEPHECSPAELAVYGRKLENR